MNWPEALQQTVSDYLEAVHHWGRADCCQFVSDYVRHRTGVDHAAKFRYGSKIEALRLLADGGIESLICQCLGDCREDAPEAGDVVVCAHAEQTIAAVYNGYFCIGFVHETPHLLRLAAPIIAAWRV